MEWAIAEIHKIQHAARAGHPITSIWDVHGPPDSVADLLREASGRDGRVIVDYDTQKNKTEKRQKLVSEELTGGRIE